MKLNKKDLLRKVATASDITLEKAQKVLSNFQSVLLESLMEEKEVQFLDIGKLKISYRKERTGVNPKTKETIVLPAKDVPRLAASRKLKSFVAKTDNVTISSFNY